jgi:hypothetical protein
MANSLEKHAGRFHYSVNSRHTIGLLASGYVGCYPLNDDISTANSKAAASGIGTTPCRQVLAPRGSVRMRRQGKVDLVPLPGEAMNNPSTASGGSCIRSGGKEHDAKDFALVGKIPWHVTIAHDGMMRLDENIHATPPPYATVAPILHKQMHGNPADRGNTPNNQERPHEFGR